MWGFEIFIDWFAADPASVLGGYYSCSEFAASVSVCASWVGDGHGCVLFLSSFSVCML